MAIKVVESLAHNPWYNLALEEYLLAQTNEGDVTLYLWQNQQTVVIGRNQNAWKECRCKLLEKEGGYLARRLSGGGAVFHDLGNLNFTFLLSKNFYDLEKQLTVILKAVREVGIEAEFSGRNDLLARGRKFSGNAYYHRDNAAYHHGTILVDSDFEQMLKYLQVSADKIKSKGVDSVRSRVVNLREINPDLTISDMIEAMKKSFQEVYGSSNEFEEINPLDMEDLKPLYDKYSSWDWRYGKTPDFDIVFKERFAWGGIELGFNLKKGHIEGVTIYSDAMDADLIQNLARSLKGIPFRQQEVIKIIDGLANEEIKTDLVNWLEDKLTQ